MPIGRDPRRQGIYKDDPRHVGLGGGGSGGAGAWGAYGARYYRQLNTAYHWVVKITKGGSTWLFSDTDMKIADGHVHGILSNDLSVECQVDYVTKQWSVQDVRVTIQNSPYRRNISNDEVKFSDEVGSIRGALIYIYVLAGIQPTALSDGYLIFFGEISEPALVSIDQIQLYAMDGARRKNKLLPQSYISDAIELRRKSPIVYGEFKNSYDSSVDLGLVRCEALQGQYKTFYLVAGHACHTLSKGYWKQPQLPHPSLLITPTLTANDSGRCTLIASQAGDYYGDVYADAHLLVDGQYQGVTTDGLGFDGLSLTVDPQKAGDLDPTTYAIIKDTINGADVHAHAYFGYPDYDSEQTQLANAVGRVVGKLVSASYYVYLEWLIDMPDISGTAYIKLLNAGSEQGTIVSGTAGSLAINVTAGQPVAWQEQILWHFRAGRLVDAGANKPIIVVVRTDTTKTPNTPGREVFRVKYIRLVVRYIAATGTIFTTYFPTIIFPNSANPYRFDRKGPIESKSITTAKSEVVAYAECKGRVFGSWIDESERSNSYSSGDCIEDPAFIVESILRDELGLASADIDTTSFDLAANVNVKSRIHLNTDNESYAFEVIRQLVEQSTFAFIVSGVSKPRLIDLDVASPTIKRTLDISDINIATLRVSRESKVINDLKIAHRWAEQYGGYLSFDNVYNSGSQADLGVFTQEFEWPNITTDPTGSLLEVANYIKDTWSVQRNTVSVFCQRSRNCDLSVGDWIRFDETSIDPHILFYGDSWAGKKFLISRVRHSPAGTSLEAVQLEVADPVQSFAVGDYSLTGISANFTKNA